MRKTPEKAGKTLVSGSQIRYTFPVQMRFIRTTQRGHKRPSAPRCHRHRTQPFFRAVPVRRKGTIYTYDSLGQVVSGKKFFSDGVPVGGAQFEYEFDTIGNRKTAKNLMGTSSVVEQYTANGLNQYENRTVAGKVLVTGEAATNATVSVRLDENSTAKLANRHGDYFWQVLTADNTSALFTTTNLQVRAFMTVVEGTNTNSLVRTETRQEIVAQTPEAFAYDADGNLVQDGVFSFAFDGENRLLTAESVSSVPDALKKKLTFAYDFQGRRVRKTVEGGFSGGAYATTNVTTFVWDGWLPVAELGAGFTNLYLHGLDLSGTLQGAGGVGGLVAISLNGTNCFPAFDGNGNLMNLINSADGSIAATYEYTPWGELIRATGPQATNNHFRFSSKWQDDETDLLCYGHRYLSPSLGRWLARDPRALLEDLDLDLTLDGRLEAVFPTGRLNEDVLNLYRFAGNSPIDQIDALGLLSISPLSGATLGKWGAFNWIARWELGPNEKETGVIVQHIKRIRDTTHCKVSASSSGVDWDYYEAWRVVKQTDGSVWIEGNALDYFGGIPHDNTRGTYSVFGEAVYYSGALKKADWTKSQPWDEQSGNGHPANGLLIAKSKPTWWDASVAQGSVAHNLVVKWCCDASSSLVEQTPCK